MVLLIDLIQLHMTHTANWLIQGTQALGTQATGTQALGTQALGTQAAGTQAAVTQVAVTHARDWLRSVTKEWLILVTEEMCQQYNSHKWMSQLV